MPAPAAVAPGDADTMTTATSSTSSGSGAAQKLKRKSVDCTVKVKNRVLKQRNSDPCARSLLSSFGAAGGAAMEEDPAAEADEELIPTVPQCEPADPRPPVAATAEDEYWSKMAMMFAVESEKQEKTILDKLEKLKLQIDGETNQKLQNLEAKMDSGIAVVTCQAKKTEESLNRVVQRLDDMEKNMGKGGGQEQPVGSAQGWKIDHLVLGRWCPEAGRAYRLQRTEALLHRLPKLRERHLEALHSREGRGRHSWKSSGEDQVRL